VLVRIDSDVTGSSPARRVNGAVGVGRRSLIGRFLDRRQQGPQSASVAGTRMALVNDPTETRAAGLARRARGDGPGAGHGRHGSLGGRGQQLIVRVVPLLLAVVVAAAFAARRDERPNLGLARGSLASTPPAGESLAGRAGVRRPRAPGPDSDQSMVVVAGGTPVLGAPVSAPARRHGPSGRAPDPLSRSGHPRRRALHLRLDGLRAAERSDPRPERRPALRRGPPRRIQRLVRHRPLRGEGTDGRRHGRDVRSRVAVRVRVVHGRRSDRAVPRTSPRSFTRAPTGASSGSAATAAATCWSVRSGRAGPGRAGATFRSDAGGSAASPSPCSRTANAAPPSSSSSPIAPGTACATRR
jgi:hypothetical protein